MGDEINLGGGPTNFGGPTDGGSTKNSAPARNSGTEGGGKSTQKAETVPPGPTKSDAASNKTLSNKEVNKENDTGRTQDAVMTGPPRKSVAERLRDIEKKRIERVKEEAVKEAKEEGKKEALKEVKKESAAKEEPTEDEVKAKAESEAAAKEAKKYEPNHKYKVKDKEMEFDDFLKGAVKEEAHEKKLRELYEKAHGLDFSKVREQELEKKYGDRETALKPVFDKMREANEALQRGEMGEVFKLMNISEEKVLQWLVNKAQYEQMDPAQRQVYDQGQESMRKAREAEKQALNLKDQNLQDSSKAKLREFELVTKIPSYKEFAESFDADRKPGAFREAVADRGELAFMKGVDLPVEDAIKQVMELYGTKKASPTKDDEIVKDAKDSAESGSKGTVKKEPPVIPNVGGRSESAVKQVPKFRSVEDLKKHRKELQQQSRSSM